MSNVLVINAHEPSPFSEGKLNAALVEKARTKLESKGHEVRVVTCKTTSWLMNNWRILSGQTESFFSHQSTG